MADIIDINVQVAVDEVNIIANPNNYIINVNRIIGEQVQSDWDQTDNQAPDYIKNKPTIPAEQVNSDWNATTGKAEILNKPTIPSIDGLATIIYVDDQDALKVDKVTGYGLSQNDFTNTLKTKLDGIQDGAEVNVNADWNATSGDAEILNKPTIPTQVTNTSELINDGEDGVHPFITSGDIPAPQVNSDWNATSGVAEILNKPTIPSIDGLATIIYVDDQDDLKVDKIAGKGLSENDFTNTLKTKLDGIQDGAEVNVNADWNATSGDAEILNKPTIPDAQVNSDWNATSGVAEILNKPTIPTPVTNTSDLINDGEDGVNPFITALDIPVGGQAGTLVREVKNMTGATLTKGTIVYISGANGNKILVSKAQASSESLSSRTFGLLQSNILNNGVGYCVIVGDLSGLDTSAFTEGVQLYLSPTTAGAYTTTKPSAPDHLVYIGKITRSHPTLGQIEVQIQNGYELQELHNVAINGVANNQLLSYDSATSLWKNKSVTTADIADSTNKRYVTDANLTTIGNQSGVNTGDQDLSGLVVKNSPITGATKTKITYDSKGLVTAGADATTADIADSTNKRYVTDANLVTIGNQSGVNTGDETTATIKTKLGITTLSGSNTGDQDLSGLTPKTTTISTTTPLQGGGDLSANRTLSILQSSTSQSGFLSSTDWNTFNSKLSLPSLTSGSVLFSNGSTIAQDNASFFWDDTNNRLGIGLNNPDYALTVAGSINVGGAGANLGIVLNSSISTAIPSSSVKAVIGVTNSGFGYAAGSLLIQPRTGVSGVVAFATEGTEKMRLTSAGNVGIGTSTPANRLSILDSASPAAAIIGGGTSTPAWMGIGTINSGTIPFIQGYNNLQTLTTNIAINPSGGNVGIGTTTPLKIFSISNTDGTTGISNARTSVIRVNNASTTLGTFSGIAFGRNNANTQTTAMIGEVLQDVSSTWASDLVFAVKSSITATDVSEYMRIKYGGNVGIGTTAPTSKLHVSGTASRLLIDESSAGYNYYDASNAHNFRDYVGTSRLYINTTNGNVGIGQNAPTKLLDVNGDALINGILIGRGAGNINSNTIVGRDAFGSNTTGSFNTFFGLGTGNSLINGSNNIFIGSYAGNGATTSKFTTIIGGFFDTTLNMFNQNSTLSIEKQDEALNNYTGEIGGLPHIWSPQTKIVVDGGTITLIQLSYDLYSSIFIEYSLEDSNGNARAGIIKAIWNFDASIINVTEDTTADIGTTAGCEINFNVGGGFLNIDLDNNNGYSVYCNTTSRILVRPTISIL